MSLHTDRQPEPGTIVVHPATPERFDDIEPVIDRSCWCQWWRQTSGEFNRSTADRQREALREQCAGQPVPGVIAYLDELPVGWCGFGPRSVMRRLERSRTIPKVDDLPVWSIVCFSVRPGYRRRGVATGLLSGAIDTLGHAARWVSKRIPPTQAARGAARRSCTRGSPACSRRRAFGASSRRPATPTTCRAG